MSISLAEFIEEMASGAEEYQLLTDGKHACRFRFIGKFEGRDVIWDVSLTALGKSMHQQYINVCHGAGDLQPVEIGLLVDILDKPSILKTIMMIRQYKLLKPGRHVFQGPAKTR